MLAVILLLIRFGHGFIANIAVLLGIMAGYLITLVLGWTSFTGMAEVPWIRVVLPLQFGLPTFHLVPCLVMCLVMMIVFVEATGMFIALGALVGRDISTEDIKRGLRADAAGTLIGGIFNTFPYLSYSQNIGLVGITGVHSRWVCAASGVIMLALGLIPKLAFIATSVPNCVLGGAAIVMFGMVAVTGIRILAAIDHQLRPHDGLIIAVSLGLGLIPILSPQFFHSVPAVLRPVFGDAILLTAIVALLLNLIFNGSSKRGVDQSHAVVTAILPHN